MDLFTDYETHCFSFETAGSGPTLEQEVLGWSRGGCVVVWSDLMPRLVAFQGEDLVGGKTVLELGAGCGLVGLVAAHFAARVDITDGDVQEERVIQNDDDLLNELDSESEAEPETPDFLDEFAPYSIFYFSFLKRF